MDTELANLRNVRTVFCLVHGMGVYPIQVTLCAGFIGFLISIYKNENPFLGFNLYVWSTIFLLVGMIFFISQMNKRQVYHGRKSRII